MNRRDAAAMTGRDIDDVPTVSEAEYEAWLDEQDRKRRGEAA